MNTKKSLLSAVALAVGLSASMTSVHAQAAKNNTQADTDKLHPMCEMYLERRASWYEATNNVEEYNQHPQLRAALVGMSYSDQQVECYAAYEAFDDIDNKAFRD